MKRRRQIIAAAMALTALRQQTKPTPQSHPAPQFVRPPPERVVERSVETVIERQADDFSGPLAAVDRRARKALEVAQAAVERADMVAANAGAFAEQVQAVRGEVERVSQQLIALAEAPLQVPPTPEPPTVVLREPIDAPTRTEVAEQLQAAVGPLSRALEESRAQIAQAARIAEEARSGAVHATSVAASAMSRDIPQPQPLPDFLVGVRVDNGRLVGIYQSGARRDQGPMPRPRVISGGRASSQQMAEWSAQGSGGGEVLLTYAAPTQVTVGSTASTIVSSGSADFRRVTIEVPSTADIGIYANPAGTATSTCWLIKSGAAGSWNTNQAISAVRAGASDVAAQVQVGTG